MPGMSGLSACLPRAIGGNTIYTAHLIGLQHPKRKEQVMPKAKGALQRVLAGGDKATGCHM